MPRARRLPKRYRIGTISRLCSASVFSSGDERIRDVMMASREIVTATSRRRGVAASRHRGASSSSSRHRQETTTSQRGASSRISVVGSARHASFLGWQDEERSCRRASMRASHGRNIVSCVVVVTALVPPPSSLLLASTVGSTSRARATRRRAPRAAGIPATDDALADDGRYTAWWW